MEKARATQVNDSPIALRIRLFARIATIGMMIVACISAIFGRVLYDAYTSLFGWLPIVGTIGVTFVFGSLVAAHRKSNPTPSNWKSKDLIRPILLTIAAVIICVFLSESLIVHGTERIHFFKYGLLCLFSFYSQARTGVYQRLIIATLFAAGVGACEEGIQSFVPHRVSEMRDVGLNAAGAGFGMMFSWLSIQWQKIGQSGSISQ